MGFLGPGVFENDEANDFARSETDKMAYLLNHDLCGPHADPRSCLVRAQFLLASCREWGSAPHSRHQGLAWLDSTAELAASYWDYPEFTETVRQTFSDLAALGDVDGSDNWRFAFLRNRTSLPVPRAWVFTPPDLAEIAKMLMIDDTQTQITAFWKLGAALDEPTQYDAHEVEEGLISVANTCLKLQRLPSSVRGACPYAIQGIMAWLCYLNTPNSNQFLVAERERFKRDALVYSFRASLRIMPPEKALDKFKTLMSTIPPEKLRETVVHGMKFPDVVTDQFYQAFMNRAIADQNHEKVADFIRPGDSKVALFLLEFQRDRKGDDDCGFVRRALDAAPAEVISEIVGIIQHSLNLKSSKVNLPPWVLQAIYQAFEIHVAHVGPLLEFVAPINAGYDDKSCYYLHAMNNSFERLSRTNSDGPSDPPQ